MNSFSSPSSPYSLLLTSLSFIPTWHYLIAFAILALSFLYNFLEFHFLQDLFFGGSLVVLTHHPSSHLYDGVVSKCRLLHGRNLATPWLSSPHLQTVFLSFFGRPPVFKDRSHSLFEILITMPPALLGSTRVNKNVVLAATKHGEHLAFFEGISASGLWWVRVTNEFLGVLLHSSQYMHVQKKISKPNTPLNSSIDQGPYVNVAEDGMVAALSNEQADNEEELHVMQGTHPDTHERFPEEKVDEDKPVTNAKCDNSSGILQMASAPDAMPLDVIVLFKRYLGRLSR